MKASSASFNRVHQLRDWVAEGHVTRLLKKGRLAANPSDALARIRRAFGCVLSQDGSNIGGIQTIRRWILTDDSLQCLAHSLAITAPHLHWPSDQAIVEIFDGNKFLLGPIRRAKGRLVPISFVFSDGGPIAYEWADESVGLRLDELDTIWSCIDRLNARFRKREWPLGVTINHRFKKVFEPPLVSTVEYLISDRSRRYSGGDDLAAIVPQYAFVGSLARRQAYAEQVAWPMVLSPTPDLTAEQSLALRKVIAIANDMPSDTARIQFLNRLRFAVS